MRVLFRMMSRAPLSLIRRRAPVRVVLVLAIVAILLLSALPACTPTQAAGVGRPAPDFSLKDLDGNTVRLRDLRGQVVFLNFWATWCPPCREEMPEIQKIHERYGDQGVTVIGIDLDETVAEVRDYTEAGGFTWTFVIDTTGSVARDYRVDVIPTSFFIDSEGTIRSIALGAMSEAQIEAKLAKALP